MKIYDVEYSEVAGDQQDIKGCFHRAQYIIDGVPAQYFIGSDAWPALEPARFWTRIQESDA
jgi:hypothetical protein